MNVHNFRPGRRTCPSSTSYHFAGRHNFFALFQAVSVERPDLVHLRARAQLALYTEANFTLCRRRNACALEPHLAENQGDSAYVYQTGRLVRGFEYCARMAAIPAQRTGATGVKHCPGRTNRHTNFFCDDGPKRLHDARGPCLVRGVSC